MSLLLRYQAAIRLFPIGPKLSSTSHKFEDASPPFASRLSLTPYFGSYRTYQDDARHRRTRSLVELVQKERYAAAERVRLHLVSECEPIDPDPVYERAAIAQIRWHGRQDLTAFLTWLALVPDNKVPLRVENGPLTKTRNILFRTGNPARNLLLITEFSLLCAAKGYGQLVWNDLVHLMVGFQHPDKALAFFLSFEAALLRYYSKYHPSFVQEIASRQRSLLIMICCDAEWLDAAVQVVRDSQEHRLNRACERLVELLQNRNDVARLAIVEELLAGRRQANDGSASENRLQVSTLDQSENMSAVQRISQMFIGSGGPSKKTSLVSSPTPFYSTRFVIEGSRTLRSRIWIASQLRQVKHSLSTRSLVYNRPPGNTLHALMAHYDACKGYPRGLLGLQKRALSLSDLCSYTWLCKEMFYLHESRKFADIVALFSVNFDTGFLPNKPWCVIREVVGGPTEPGRIINTVPTKLEITPADAWIVWNALVRLSVNMPAPLPVLEALHHSVLHYSSTLTDRQFRAFPTSYTAVFRSIIWAYGECGDVQKAAAAADDMSLIGKGNGNDTHLDELVGVYIRSGDVPPAKRLLRSLEEKETGPRLATYGVMMNAYLQAGLVDEASELELRMKEKCQYIPGANWRMDATLKALRAAEDALDPEVTT